LQVLKHNANEFFCIVFSSSSFLNKVSSQPSVTAEMPASKMAVGAV